MKPQGPCLPYFIAGGGKYINKSYDKPVSTLTTFVTIKALKCTVFHLPMPLTLQVDQYINNIIGIFCIHKSSLIPGQIYVSNVFV